MQLGGITTKRYVWYLHLTDADDSYDSLSCGTCKLFVAPAYVFKFLLATATHCFPPTAVRARTVTSKGLDALPRRRLSDLPLLMVYCIDGPEGDDNGRQRRGDLHGCNFAV